jgi:hypothetical protein
MNMKLLTLRVLCFAIAVTAAGTAHAQTTRSVDVGVGYSFFRFTEAEGYNVPFGWLVSVAGPVGDGFSVAGEVAGNYDFEEGETLAVHTYQAGPRIGSNRNPNVRPFVQFLFGGATASGGGESDTRFAIEPGGGVDVPAGGRLALRMSVGFPMVFAEGETVNAFRFHAGIVF